MYINVTSYIKTKYTISIVLRLKKLATYPPQFTNRPNGEDRINAFHYVSSCNGRKGKIHQQKKKN